MNYKEEYKKLYFELVIINKKINDLKHSNILIDYLNNKNNNEDFIIKKYIKLNNKKNELLNLLSDLYNEMELNEVYLFSPIELMFSIYQRLKSIYPNIDDATINHYIKASLFNIKYKDNTFDRQQSRIKRLNLNNLYNNWYYKIERN